MIKFMKYEFLRARMNILIILSLFITLELTFLLSILLKNEKMYVVSVTCLSIFGFVCVFYIFVSGILSYSRDLLEKTGMLVFMVPLSPYRLIGAKLMVIFIESIVFVILFFLFSFFDIFLVLHSFGDASWSDVLDALCISFQIGNRDEVLYFLGNLGSVILLGFISLFTFFTFAYLSISISVTILQNKKANNLFSLLIFIVLIVVYVYVEEKIPRMNVEDFYTSIIHNWPVAAFSVVCSIIAFFIYCKVD